MSTTPNGKSVYEFDCEMVCSDGRRLRIKGHSLDLYNVLQRFISGGKSGEVKVEFAKGGVAGIKILETVR